MYAVRILGREVKHQRTLGWPQAPARLSDGPDRLPLRYRNIFQNVRYYRAELEHPYVFYARGVRYTGNRLAPGKRQLSESDASTFLKELAKHRRYRVYFNPDDPTDNYLTAGTEVMAYLEVFMLATVGIVLPYIISCSPFFRQNLSGREVIILLLVVPVITVFSYHSARPPFQLAQRLNPMSESDIGKTRLELMDRQPVIDKASILRSAAKKS